jgi:acetyl-CoA C-acetyltransferase
VTGDALADRQFDRTAIDRIVLGMTIPQAHSYGAPWLASRLGLPDVSGPLIAQACATSVACSPPRPRSRPTRRRCRWW